MVREGENGSLRISMPRMKIAGEYVDIAYPITAAMRKTITDAVQTEYQRVAALEPEERSYDPTPVQPPDKLPHVSVQMRLTPDSGSQLGTGSAVIGACFVIRGVRVMNGGEKGLFVAMPSRLGQNGQFRDIAFPVTTDMMQKINNAVMEQYQQRLDKAAGKETTAPEKGAPAAGERAEEKPKKKVGKEKTDKKPSVASRIEAAKQEAQARNEARQQETQECQQPNRDDPGQER